MNITHLICHTKVTILLTSGRGGGGGGKGGGGGGKSGGGGGYGGGGGGGGKGGGGGGYGNADIRKIIIYFMNNN